MSLRAEIHKKLGAFSLDISLETQGGVLGLLGASGCGKSMTLKCIAGIEKPDSGYIALDGTVLFDSKRGINLAPQQRKVGYLFQNYALFPHMTVRQNILCGLKWEKRREIREQKYRDILKPFAAGRAAKASAASTVRRTGTANGTCPHAGQRTAFAAAG